MLSDECLSLKELALMCGSTQKLIGRALEKLSLRIVGGRPTRKAVDGGYVSLRYYPNHEDYPLTVWHKEKTLAALKTIGITPLPSSTAPPPAPKPAAQDNDADEDADEDAENEVEDELYTPVEQRGDSALYPFSFSRRVEMQESVRQDETSEVQTNQCGGCTACCILYSLPESNKPARTPCRHLCEAGCSIHDHPISPICTGFECGYLRFPWDINLRPDKCGVIFAFDGFRGSRRPGIAAHNRPGAWTAYCLTSEAFTTPAPSVVEFITREVKEGGSVIFMSIEDGWTRIALYGCAFADGTTQHSYPNDNVDNPTFPNDVYMKVLTIDTDDAGQSVVNAVDP
jgi:hypothetical protein